MPLSRRNAESIESNTCNISGCGHRFNSNGDGGMARAAATVFAAKVYQSSVAKT